MVDALRLHPHLVSDLLPSALPRLSLTIESLAERQRSATIEWQV